MCQLKAVVERENYCETVMESVTSLEVIGDGVLLSTYFEEPLTVQGVRVRSINLLTGAIVLTSKEKEA
ncbi:CooT family nickel-binding protein [Candidatus Electronema sp. PJ]|uniref:CooT family nickel-binding protein n=1 Tax=Candidatus Electronema sp. PJ TaxID=3401572 RepID=UPI003AA8B733